MITANIHNAKTHLSELIAKALEGEEVIIGKAGKHLVRLVPIDVLNSRRSGQWKGQVLLAEDFDLLPDDFQKYFDGEG